MDFRRYYHPGLVMPAFLLYSLLFVVPVVFGVGFSFTDWNTLRSNIRFIGVANYLQIFSDDSGPYLLSLMNTLAFTGVTVLGKMVFGLLLALLLNGPFRSRDALRSLFFSTYTLSPLIVGIIFVSILSGEGVLNALLTSLGLEGLSHSWLSSPDTALGATMAVEIWRMSGFNMVIFLAGLQMIPKEFYEAAEIDGAGLWDRLLRITLPQLLPTFMVVAVLNTIHGLKVFDVVFALTGGGPGYLTEVINTQVFREFGDGRYGFANTLNTVVFLLTLLSALLIRRLFSRKEVTA